jgi:hypothetical protein
MDNFYHDDQVIQGFRDFRSDGSQPPALSKMIYIALRVKTGNAVWYHHTAMAIDCDLYSHVESLKCVLRASLNRPNAEIACVFVRSFITQDASFQASADQVNIINEMNARIENGAIFCDHVKKILVFGFIGKDRIILLDVAANDAMDANEDAIKMCAEQFKEQLNTIELMAVSPAIPGIIKLFEKRAPQLLAHVNSPCSVGRHISQE